MSQRVEDFDDTLADFGVHAGFPKQRRELAEQLASDESLARYDLDLLGQHAEQETKNGQREGWELRAAARLAWRLSEPDRWQTLLSDLRRAEKARTGRASPDAPEFGASDRQKDQQRQSDTVNAWPDSWKQQDLDRHLLAIWRGDLRSDPKMVGEAGTRLGVTEIRAKAGIERQLASEGIEGGIQGYLDSLEQQRKRSKQRKKRIQVEGKR